MILKVGFIFRRYILCYFADLKMIWGSIYCSSECYSKLNIYPVGWGAMFTIRRTGLYEPIGSFNGRIVYSKQIDDESKLPGQDKPSYFCFNENVWRFCEPDDIDNKYCKDMHGEL